MNLCPLLRIMNLRNSVFNSMYGAIPCLFKVNTTRILFCSKIIKRNYYVTPFIQIKRNKFRKHSKRKEKDESESDSDIEEEETLVDINSKIISARMQSLRVDSILKAGLGLARNKVETLFYEDKILVNGKKVTKKSAKLEVDDEVDVIKESLDNTFISVSRLVILTAEENDNGDGLVVKMKRYKNLKIENS